MQGCASGRGGSRHRLSHDRRLDLSTRRGLRPAGMRSIPLRPCADSAIPDLPATSCAPHRARSSSRSRSRHHRLARFAHADAKSRFGRTGSDDQPAQSARLRSRSFADTRRVETSPVPDADPHGTRPRQSLADPGSRRLEPDARPPQSTRRTRFPPRPSVRRLHARHASLARPTAGPIATGRMPRQLRRRRRHRGP